MKPKLIIALLFGGIIFFANQVFATDLAINSVSQTNEPSPFKITATPRTNQVHIMEPFKVSLEVENISKTNQSFVIMSCSWTDNWHSDNEMVGWKGWNCQSNFGYTKNMAPGEIFRQEGEMRVFRSALTNKVSFRMALHPGNYNDPSTDLNYKRGKNYWSNEVTIEVIPD